MNKGFKPLLVEFQEEQFNLDKANKSNKVECLLSIKDWILKYIGDVDLDLKKLTNDFVGYFLDIVAKRFVKEILWVYLQVNFWDRALVFL